MLNHIVVMGRLTRDPELRYTPAQIPVASFTLAVDRDIGGKDDEKITDFIDIVAWRKTAEFASKYFSKGSMAVADGRLQIRDWTDKNGNKRRSAEVVAERIYFGDSKKSDSKSNAYSGPQQGGSSYDAGGYGNYDNYSTGSSFGDLSDVDGELPF